MPTSHKIEIKIGIEDYLAIISKFTAEEITTTNHTFFRLEQKQRKIFKDTIIKNIILSKIPILVGIQYNKLYAAFYKHNKDTIKLVLDIQSTKIGIVTFYLIDNKQIPRIKNAK